MFFKSASVIISGLTPWKDAPLLLHVLDHVGQDSHRVASLGCYRCSRLPLLLHVGMIFTWTRPISTVAVINQIECTRVFLVAFTVSGLPFYGDPAALSLLSLSLAIQRHRHAQAPHMQTSYMSNAEFLSVASVLSLSFGWGPRELCFVNRNFVLFVPLFCCWEVAI